MNISKFILLSLAMLLLSGTASADKWCEIIKDGTTTIFNTDKVIMVIKRPEDGAAGIVFEGKGGLFETKIQYRELVERCFK